eukprot:6869860-Prymnesium_polylepis.1
MAAGQRTSMVPELLASGDRAMAAGTACPSAGLGADPLAPCGAAAPSSSSSSVAAVIEVASAAIAIQKVARNWLANAPARAASATPPAASSPPKPRLTTTNFRQSTRTSTHGTGRLSLKRLT